MLNAKKKNPLCCSVALHCFPLFGAKSLSAYVEGDFVHASMSFSERERERERELRTSLPGGVAKLSFINVLHINPSKP